MPNFPICCGRPAPTRTRRTDSAAPRCTRQRSAATCVAERDGFDMPGLLLAPPPDAGAQPYLFVVGIVRREAYRPLVDIRLVALATRGGRLEWTVGEGDPQALMRYRTMLDPTPPLRFPADKDRFELVPCAPRICADDPLSSARWSLAVPAPAAAPQ
jgi:hypothetical protein